MPQNSNAPDLYLDRFYHISLIYDVFVGSRRPLKISKGTVLHVRFIDYNVVNNIEYYTLSISILITRVTIYIWFNNYAF